MYAKQICIRYNFHVLLRSICILTSELQTEGFHSALKITKKKYHLNFTQFFKNLNFRAKNDRNHNVIFGEKFQNLLTRKVFKILDIFKDFQTLCI